MKRFLTQGWVISAVFLLAPIIAFADIVPCDGPTCDLCDIMKLGGNLLEFFVTFSVIAAGLLFAWGGFQMVTSAGDIGKVKKGTNIMTDSIVGIVIILSSWLLMDTALKLFVNNNDAGQQVYGMWNEIQCNEIAPSSAQSATGGAVSPMVIGEPTFSETEMQNRLRQTEKYKDQLCTYARLNGIPDQCDVLFALTATESGGISSRSSEDGAVGLMQVMPDTAREMLDGKLGSAPTDAAIRTYLHTPSQNIEVGVKYYAQLYRQHNGDVTKVLAAYNGGNTALEPSAHCSGMAKWQCEWDNVEHTQPNVGYKETRDYIANITAMTEYVAGN